MFSLFHYQSKKCRNLQQSLRYVKYSNSTCFVSERYPVCRQVGLMLNGMAIDNMVVGGPAYNSGQLQQNDVIVQIDGMPVSNENIHDSLLGSDIPGSTVTITVRRGYRDLNRVSEKPDPLWFAKATPFKETATRDNSNIQGGTTHVVVLTRMATEVIADRRRMFELLTIMKVCPIFVLGIHNQRDSTPNDDPHSLQVQAQLRNDTSSASTVDDCIEVLTKMLIADSVRAEAVSEGVKAMQRECISMLEVLVQYVEMLERPLPGSPQDSRTRERARPLLDRERASATGSTASQHDVTTITSRLVRTAATKNTRAVVA